MRRNTRALFLAFIGLFIVASTFVAISQVQTTQKIETNAQGASFRFAIMDDTNGVYSTTQSIIPQVVALNPSFGLFAGDVETAGYTQSGIASWKSAMGGMLNKTFAVRGNHDNTTSGSAGNWANAFDFQTVAQQIGATNFSALNADLTYSFDYANAHFVGIDGPGDVRTITSAQISWLDQDLTAAESRGLTHAFLFWHGPTYYVASHPSNPPEELIAVINKHPLVSATFHGHEHVQTHVHLSSSRISSLTHQYEQFTGGSMGGGPVSCNSSRSDWCVSQQGFAIVDVNGPTVTVTFYARGNATAVNTVTFQSSVSVSPPFYCSGSQYCVPSVSPAPTTNTPTNPVVVPTSNTVITPSDPQPTQIIYEPPSGNDSPKNNNRGGNLIDILLEFIRLFFELLLRLFGKA